MKQLKFNSDLIPLVLNGSKNVTWRLFDDKNLSTGDILEFLDAASGEKFADAIIENVIIKPIEEINLTDRIGHEPVGEGRVLLNYYEKLYKRIVSPKESIKVIRFKLK